MAMTMASFTPLKVWCSSSSSSSPSPWSVSSRFPFATVSIIKSSSKHLKYHQIQIQIQNRFLHIVSCIPPSQSQSQSEENTTSSTKLYVSGLSFRTSQESLRNAFQSFGQLLEVNLVMDKIANRPRGFAFLRYATNQESHNAIQGMHGKFLDGRVIFVEFAKPRSHLSQGVKPDSKPYR